jgi:hypothetical protein
MTATDQRISSLLLRIRSEFLEMPGLNVTPPQAARLWALDPATLELVLGELVSSGFLSRSRGGAYLRATAA